MGKAETAQALGISPATLTAWEQGRRDPQGEGRAAYARLPDGVAAQLADAAAETAAEREPERGPEPASAPGPESKPEPRAAFLAGPKAAAEPAVRPAAEPASPQQPGRHCTGRPPASTLATLYRSGLRRITELAAIEGVTQPAMTVLVRVMEESGLVEPRATRPTGGSRWCR
nr:MarR family transcriptional regulator [Streptomyces sp. TLI_171]